MKYIITLALIEPLYVKNWVYVISMLSQGYDTTTCNVLGFFMFLLII